MPPSADAAATGPDPERAYYLASFRGRVLVLAASTEEDTGECRAVARELARAGATVVLVVPGPDEMALPERLLDVWRRLGTGVVEVSASRPREAAVEIAAGGRVHKLVLVGEDLVLADPAGGRRSFVDVARAGLPARLQQLARPLYEGVDGVNVVGPGQLAAELFTYEGSGTLLTRGEYGEVRRLGFADYEPVTSLLLRGVELGYLRPRTQEEVEALLPRALAFFAAGDLPAGVVALAAEQYRGTGRGEVEALFTISRFHGEGVGRRLVAALDGEAGRADLTGLFAVTTSADAADFFASCGYREAGRDEVPAPKWRGYPPDRIGAARCFVRDL